MMRVIAAAMGFAAVLLIVALLIYAGFHDWRFAFHIDTFGWPEIAGDITMTVAALTLTGWLMVTEIRAYGRRDA